MKPESARGVRAQPRRRGGPPREAREAAGRLASTAVESPEARFDPVEFAEFLDAEDLLVPVDPSFRERLREQLWQLVWERVRRPRRRGP